MPTLPPVLDVNDETPTFFPAVYNVSVSEDVPREFRVVWLNCTDSDVGLNAELSYFITGERPARSGRGKRGSYFIAGAALPPRPSGEQPAQSGLGKRGRRGRTCTGHQPFAPAGASKICS